MDDRPTGGDLKATDGNKAGACRLFRKRIRRTGKSPVARDLIWPAVAVLAVRQYYNRHTFRPRLPCTASGAEQAQRSILAQERQQHCRPRL